MDPAKCPSDGSIHSGSYCICIPHGFKRCEQGWPDQGFAGLANFRKVTASPVFAMVLKNTLVWTVAVVGISTLLGFILAILLNNEFKGRKLARAVVVFPWATTLIVSGKYLEIHH